MISKTERLEAIDGFPDYVVSDQGYVFSLKTDQALTPSEATGGAPKVNMIVDGHVHTRSVKVLVAKAFVEKDSFFVSDRGNESIEEPDVPINLDGDRYNNHYTNLAWRPRWLAWKYKRQFERDIPPEYNRPVFNELSERYYDSIMDAGIADGVLWEYVYQSTATGRPVFPTGATYVFTDGP